MLGRFFLLFSLFVCLPQFSEAAEDVRLQVEIANHEIRGARPDLAAAMRQALPVLWDRLIPQTQRKSAKSLKGEANMISRIAPGEEGTLVDFNQQSVFDYLSRSNIAYLATAPSFHLVIQMQNSVGLPMRQSERLLGEYAKEIVPRWGIELSALAPNLMLRWQWLDASQVRLSMHGDTRLQAFSKTRDIGDSDPFEYMQGWLEELLLQARDAYAFVPGSVTDPSGRKAAENLDGWLLIKRPLSLGEQAALEEALRNDPRVLQLIPHTYGHHDLRYRLVLKGFDTSWVDGWFKRRDLQIESVAGGWKVR